MYTHTHMYESTCFYVFLVALRDHTFHLARPWRKPWSSMKPTTRVARSMSPKPAMAHWLKVESQGFWWILMDFSGFRMISARLSKGSTERPDLPDFFCASETSKNLVHPIWVRCPEMSRDVQRCPEMSRVKVLEKAKTEKAEAASDMSDM